MLKDIHIDFTLLILLLLLCITILLPRNSSSGEGPDTYNSMIKELVEFHKKSNNSPLLKDWYVFNRRDGHPHRIYFTNGRWEVIHITEEEYNKAKGKE